MTAKPWLRHPPRIIRPPAACPTGRTRYRTPGLAITANWGRLGSSRGHPGWCGVCTGFHLTDPTEENR